MLLVKGHCKQFYLKKKKEEKKSISRQCSLRLVVSHLEVSFGRYEQAMVFAPGGEPVGGFVWQV